MIVFERAFDRLPHPRARRQAAPLRRFPHTAIQRLRHEDLQPMTHMSILIGVTREFKRSRGAQRAAVHQCRNAIIRAVLASYPHAPHGEFMKRIAAITAVVAVIAGAFLAHGLRAQNRMRYSVVSPESGHVALGLAVRKLNVSGTFMQAPAHPDDETNALFAMFTHGMGLRSVDVQNNRGEGGQNEIGPELFRDIGVLRTSELVAAHRVDGAEQYFTRAIDYGYSFDPEEVINKWGRDAIVGDYVRLIRTLRPDVLVTMNIQGRGGDRAHEATTVLVREAYRASGNAQMYPEQIRGGLHAWQPKQPYFSAGFSGGRGGPGGGRGR